MTSVEIIKLYKSGNYKTVDELRVLSDLAGMDTSGLIAMLKRHGVETDVVLPGTGRHDRKTHKESVYSPFERWCGEYDECILIEEEINNKYRKKVEALE